MRRFSQRNSLVTLSDINITPLLDLAFVLLIIFVITTPLLEQGLTLSLPEGGREDRKLDPRDNRTVDVSKAGAYKFRGIEHPAGPEKIVAILQQEQQRNPNIIVAIRGDKVSQYGHIIRLIDQLEKNKLLQTKVNRELEEKVADRTAELEVEKQKLDAANKELASMAEELNKINSRLDFDNWHLQKNLKEETKSRIIHEKVSYEEYCTIFPNDFSCFKYLEEIKWTGGYSCKKCSNHKYSELSDEHLQFQLDWDKI